jgi:hypothetical protein
MGIVQAAMKMMKKTQKFNVTNKFINFTFSVLLSRIFFTICLRFWFYLNSQDKKI